MGCGGGGIIGGIGDFFAGFDDMVHSTVEGIVSTAKFYVTHPLEAVEVAALMYVGVPPTVAMSTVNYANGHGTIQQVGISVAKAYVSAEMGSFSIEGVPPEMMQVMTSASASAATAALQGKPLSEVLTAGLSGSVQGLVINQLKDFAIANDMKFDPKDLSTQVLSNAVRSATGAILNGKNIGDAIAASTSSSIISYGMKEASTAVGKTWDEIYKNSETLQEIGNAFSETKAKAIETWNDLTSFQVTAKSQFDTANGLYTEVNQLRDEINSLVPAYDAAKAKVENYVPNMQAEGYTLVRNYRIGSEGPEFREGTSVFRKFWAGDGTPTDGPDRRTYIDGRYSDGPDISVFKDEAAAIANKIDGLGDQYTTKLGTYNTVSAEYKDTLDNKLNPTINKYTNLTTELTSLNDKAVDLNDKTQKLTVDLVDKYKTFEELKEKYGEELAQQIADEAAKTIKADQEAAAAKAAEELKAKQDEEAKQLAIQHAKEAQDAKDLEEKNAREAEDKKAAEAAAAVAAKELLERQAREAKELADKHAAEEAAEEARLAEEEAERVRLADEEAERRRIAAEEAERRRLADEVKPVTPVTPAGPQVGDMSDAAPGTKVTLADGTIGVVSNSGKIVPEGTVSDLTPVVNPTVTTGPVEPKDEEPTDTTPQPTDTDVIPDDAERQPDGTFLDPKTGVKYIVNDDGTVTTMFPKDAEPTIGPPGPGPDVLEPTTWTPPPNAVQNPDGSYTVTNDDGSTNTYSKDGDPVGSTDATDTTDPTIGPVVPGPDAPPVGPTNPDTDLDTPYEDDTTPDIVNEEGEEPPADSTPEQKYNFYLKKGVPEPSARIRSGFIPKVPPVTPVKPVTPTPVKPPITTLPPVTPLPTPPGKPTTPTAPPVQYDNSWYKLASLLGAPDLAAQVYNQIPMQKGGLATLKPKKHGLASLTTQNRRSK